jgi:hypothetical protein
MTSSTQQPLEDQPAGGEIVARAGRYYRNTRYLIAAGLFLMGLWFIRDGFSKWPRENAEALAAGKSVVPHPGLDVPMNKVFGIVLPPLSILLLARWLYVSRGEYRLSGQTLSVPGHPPIPFDMITAIDQRQWDRKGIAYVNYEVNKVHGRLKLDDFIYERRPTDEIYAQIVRFVAPPAEQETAARTAPEPEDTKSPET